MKLSLLLALLSLCTIGCSVHKRAESIPLKKTDVNYPSITSESEVFDTSKFSKPKWKINIENHDTSYRRYGSYSYEELDSKKHAIKYYQRGGTKLTTISGYDYSVNPIFGIYKEYTYTGRLMTKGIYCWFGFNVGKWFYYKKKGNLKQTIDFDEGYKFDVDSVFSFCKTHDIPLKKVEEGQRTYIRKRKTHDGEPIWVINYPNWSTHQSITLTVNGRNGEYKEIERFAMPLN